MYLAELFLFESICIYNNFTLTFHLACHYFLQIETFSPRGRKEADIILETQEHSRPRELSECWTVTRLCFEVLQVVNNSWERSVFVGEASWKLGRNSWDDPMMAWGFSVVQLPNAPLVPINRPSKQNQLGLHGITSLVCNHTLAWVKCYLSSYP